ncbi:MAG: glutamate--tRNA ligase [Pseudomonadota bacterium]
MTGAPLDDAPVITRFAPSPTGRLHVGNIRSAVLNWLTARAAGGRFILRLDDTDAERSTEAFGDAIRRDLDWLGLHWDESFRQSERFDAYHAAADRLVRDGKLYEAFETPEELELRRRTLAMRGLPPIYDRAALKLSEAERAALRAEGRRPVRRFLLDGQDESWEDLVRGTERVDCTAISDPVLFRADGQLLYTLASVVDDAETGITHVIRGADHVTNTGAQLQIFRALEQTPPAFGHHSLLTGPEGEGLSKRLGSLSIGQLRDAGIEAIALVSFLARLGSARPVEPATRMEDVIAGFALSSFGRAPTKFDEAELTLHSAKTLRAFEHAAVAPRLAGLGVPPDEAPGFWAAVGPNLDRLEEAGAWWALCRDGAVPIVAPEDAGFVAEALAVLPPRPWSTETWGAWTGALKAETGRKGKALFRPLRLALTGRDRGPDMALLMPHLRVTPAPEAIQAAAAV